MIVYFKIEINEFFLGHVTKKLMPDSWCFLAPVIDGKESYGMMFKDHFQKFVSSLDRYSQNTLRIVNKKDIEALNTSCRKILLYNLYGNLQLIPGKLSRNIPDVTLN